MGGKRSSVCEEGPAATLLSASIEVVRNYSPPVMSQFYRSVIESVLTLSVIIWHGYTTEREKKDLNRVVKSASRIIGIDQPSVEIIYNDRMVKKAMSIAGDRNHPANSLFCLMRSGRRYQSLVTGKGRSLRSFYPSAIRALNKSLV